MAEQQIGIIQHYFDKISVAIIAVTEGEVSIGDVLHIKGHTTDVSTKIESMQLDHQKVERAGAGESVGVRIPATVRPQDKVFKITS